MSPREGAADRNRRTGSAIRKRRQELGMSQAELAASIGKKGVSISTVQKWENGTHYPERYLGSVEKVLGISLSDDEPAPAPPALPPGLLAAIYDELPPERAERVAALIEAELSGRPLPAPSGPRGTAR